MTTTHQKKPPCKIWWVILPIIAMSVNVIFCFIAFFVINNLPRVSPGNHVIIPWEICLIGVGFFQIIGPWMVSLIALRSPKLWIYFLICLIISFVIVNLLLGEIVILDKAWRRGV